MRKLMLCAVAVAALAAGAFVAKASVMTNGIVEISRGTPSIYASTGQHGVVQIFRWDLIPDGGIINIERVRVATASNGYVAYAPGALPIRTDDEAEWVSETNLSPAELCAAYGASGWGMGKAVFEIQPLSGCGE